MKASERLSVRTYDAQEFSVRDINIDIEAEKLSNEYIEFKINEFSIAIRDDYFEDFIDAINKVSNYVSNI